MTTKDVRCAREIARDFVLEVGGDRAHPPNSSESSNRL